MTLFLDYARSTDLYRELCRASAAGQIVRLRNPQNDRTTWSYDDAGRTTVQRLANGARASYSYDDADQVLRLANIKSDGTTISSFDYKYDPAGNRSRVVEANGDRVTWSYDNTYQLTREQRSGANSYHLTYSYDAAGNRLSKRDAGTPTTYSYDAANQLQTEKTPSGTTTYTFDNNGNQSRKVEPGGGRTTWAWDYEDRLSSVRLPSGVRNTMAYDADGRRVEKQDSTGTTKHIWDLENILLETDQSNLTQAVYTLEPQTYGNLISQVRGGTSAFALFDALGSADRLTNSAGTVTDSYLYQAFGVIQASSGSTANPFRYVGRLGYSYNIDLVTYYLRARQYDPGLGRFSTIDRLQFADGPNVYSYVRNRPLIATDPSGDLAVTTVLQFPNVVQCGVAAVVFWSFSLEKKAPCNGYFVQQIDFKCEFGDCCGQCPKAPPNQNAFQFWEAWYVRKDQRVTDIFPRGIFPPFPWFLPPVLPLPFIAFTDSAVIAPFKGSCGAISATGTIKFFCETTTGDLGRPGQNPTDPNSTWRIKQVYGASPCQSSPFLLPSVGRIPPWWNNRPIEGPANRSATGVWNCCPGQVNFVRFSYEPRRTR